jgi:hypothetical protein
MLICVTSAVAAMLTRLLPMSSVVMKRVGLRSRSAKWPSGVLAGLPDLAELPVAEGGQRRLRAGHEAGEEQEHGQQQDLSGAHAPAGDVALRERCGGRPNGRREEEDRDQA